MRKMKLEHALNILLALIILCGILSIAEAVLRFLIAMGIGT